MQTFRPIKISDSPHDFCKDDVTSDLEGVWDIDLIMKWYIKKKNPEK